MKFIYDNYFHIKLFPVLIDSRICSVPELDPKHHQFHVKYVHDYWENIIIVFVVTQTRFYCMIVSFLQYSRMHYNIFVEHNESRCFVWLAITEFYFNIWSFLGLLLQFEVHWFDSSNLYEFHSTESKEAISAGKKTHACSNIVSHS